jgi:hypothetical protein
VSHLAQRLRDQFKLTLVSRQRFREFHVNPCRSNALQEAQAVFHHIYKKKSVVLRIAYNVRAEIAQSV